MATERAFADTNLFLRYLTNDVPDQADAVEDLFHLAAADEITLVTNNLVIAEIVWTLESFYGLSRDEVKDKVLAIINTPGIEVMEQDLILQSIVWHAEKNVDFIDAYNAAWMLAGEMTEVYTFDLEHFGRFEDITARVPASKS
jgi:predicted nucleic-acid-binding protein